MYKYYKAQYKRLTNILFLISFCLAASILDFKPNILVLIARQNILQFLF